MKGIPINPYHLVAIYDNNTEASLQGHLYSPADALPPIQFETAERSNVASWSLVRVSDGATYAQAIGGWYDFDHDDGQFHTYFGGALSTPVPDGIYRARIVLANADVYWSHALCCSTLFSALTGNFSLMIESCQQNGEFVFNFVATGADYVEVYLEDVFQASYGPEFQVVGPSSPPFTTYNYDIILKRDYEAENGGRVTLQREYTFVVFSTGACFANTLTPGSVSGSYGEELAFLEWWGDNDRKTQKIVYQSQGGDEYRQRFYGKFWRAAPEARVENNFIVDANGNLTRRSATAAEAIILECWPVPDYAFTVLANAGNHENIQVSNMDGEPTPVDRFEFSTAEVGEDDRHKGVFSLTINTQYVSGCQEDYVEGVPD